MYQARLSRIKERLFDKEFVTKKEWWGGDKTILSCDEVKSLPLIIRKALAIEYTMSYMPAELRPDELIVGMRTQGSAGTGRVMPTYALPEEEEVAAKYSFSSHSAFGHYPARFQTIVEKGIVGICAEIDEALEKEARSEHPNAEKLNFYQALKISIRSVQRLADRYARMTFAAAIEEQNPERKKELFEMSAVCRRVPMYPASSFQEALQSVFFLFCALHSTMEFIPIGRADQFLFPYYENDIKNGVITEERARELVGCWIAKFAEVTQMLPEHWELDRASDFDFSLGSDSDTPPNFVSRSDTEENYGVAANNVLNNIILGGLTPEGECAVNDLTYIILEEWAFFEVVTPVVSVRLNSKTPEKLIKLSADILRKGSGEPALYNDDIIIDALVKLGIPLDDARDYSNDGCWEILIPGKTNFTFDFVELGKCLEYVLTQGRSLVNEKIEVTNLKNPLDFKSYDEFYDAFLTLVKQKIDNIIDLRLRYYKYRDMIAPSPLLSSVLDGCIENGLGNYTGGARYNIYTIMLTEAATSFDSLAVLKKLVYEDKVVDMQTLINACEGDFVGFEDLQQVFLKVPKYGNDDDYVDLIGRKLLKDISDYIVEINKSGRTGIFKIGLGIGTFEHYQQLGYGLGASPDGRNKHASISSNFSPSIGVDINGPTAAIKSLTKMDLTDFATGCMLDLQINSNEVTGEDGLARMVALIKAFMKLDGQILTLTGVSKEDMIDAQIHPENHKSLRVRIGGFSAYFISLSKEQQNIMIRKSKHAV